MNTHDLMRELRESNNTKIVLLVADGLGGLPMQPGGKTELETARTPNLDQLAREGKPAMSAEEADEFKRPILEKYENEGNPYHSTARLWDDGVIDPVDTRQILGLALSVVLNSPVEEQNFGVFRM